MLELVITSLEGYVLAIVFLALWFHDRQRTYNLQWAIGHALLRFSTVVGVFADLYLTGVGRQIAILIAVMGLMGGVVAILAGVSLYRGFRIPTTGFILLWLGMVVLSLLVNAVNPFYGRLAIASTMGFAFLAIAAILAQIDGLERIVAVLYGLRGLNTFLVPILATQAVHPIQVEIGHLLTTLSAIGLILSEFFRVTQSLRYNNQALKLLNNLNKRMSKGGSELTLAQEALAAIMALSKPKMAAIYIFDEAEGRGTQLHRLIQQDDTGSQGHGPDLLPSPLPVEKSLSGRAALTGEVIWSAAIADDERILPKLRQDLLALGLKSVASVPLMSYGQALGALNIYRTVPYTFADQELRVLKSIGQTLGLAIANARHLERLQYQATHDSLTRLPNRDLLHAEFQRLQPSPMFLFLLDLDGFKEVNDTLGHQVGDQLLCQIGPRIQRAINDPDVLICRLGGDEFAILFPGFHSQNMIVVLANRIAQALRMPFVVSGLSLSLSASIGVAHYPTHGEDSHSLLRCADVAMYYAKRKSSSMAYYHPRFDNHTPERLAMMAELEQALRSQQFVLHFQPKICLSSGQVLGCESLIRWQHPQKGLLSPGLFMPMAEMSDLIHAITVWVISEGFAHQRHWRDRGVDIVMAINLSTRNLFDQSWPSRLQTMLQSFHINPKQVELEITETVLMQDAQLALKMLDQIAELGISLAIDDFGTGYSSLSYLKQFPIQTLKIDRSFVADMMVNAHSRAIVQSTIDLAHKLDLQVTAEGVENQESLDLLCTLGCDHAQGYYISPPLPVDRFEEWIHCPDYADPKLVSRTMVSSLGVGSRLNIGIAEGRYG